MKTNKQNHFKTIIVIVTVLSLILIAEQSFSQQDCSGLLYYSQFESSRFDEIAWFTPGSYNGNVHSMDYFGFRWLPVEITGFLSTGRNRLVFYPGVTLDSLTLSHEPIYNQMLFHLPEDALLIRRNANPWIPSMNGRNMTWIHLRGVRGIDIFQYPLGTPRTDSLYVHLSVPNWQAVFVDGECEIEGEFAGSFTIGCRGNMWLIGDIRYVGADRNTGDFDDNMRHRLGLMSEQNIIIKDNIVNGQNNGCNVAPNDPDRHSIVINAALISLGDSFRFEHTNEDHDLYQAQSRMNAAQYI